MILGILASAGGGAATAYESIATATGTGSSGTISFTSIPSTYTHLQIRLMGRSDNAASASDHLLQLNTDTGANYTYHALYGDGSAPGSFGAASTTSNFLGSIPYGLAAANIMGVSVIDILDYASTTKNKTVRVLNGHSRNAAGNIYLTSGLWINTAAITSVQIKTNAGNFTTASTFALYGIKAA
jgi:hypothetical protein